MTKDESNLQLLSVFHYIMGAFGCLFSFMPLIHLFLGLAFILAPAQFQGQGGEMPPEFVGWLFFGLGLFFFVMGQTVSICIILSGRFIARRKNYLYSFILACIECMFVPFGTILGVFTIVTLSKESVKKLYGKINSNSETIN